ncbi:hypothetical protein CPZ32_00335 [Bacillus cereus]|nr:hypothetical protein CPZ32_00335 [Bacillus cereus]
MKKHIVKEKVLLSRNFNLFPICFSYSISKTFKVHTIFKYNMCETVDSHDFSTLAITGALFGLKIAITPNEIVVT